MDRGPMRSLRRFLVIASLDLKELKSKILFNIQTIFSSMNSSKLPTLVISYFTPTKMHKENSHSNHPFLKYSLIINWTSSHKLSKQLTFLFSSLRAPMGFPKLLCLGINLFLCLVHTHSRTVFISSKSLDIILLNLDYVLKKLSYFKFMLIIFCFS